MHDAYEGFVARSPQGSVFATAWWLDAVAPGRWRAHTLEENGTIVAAWPTVVRSSRWGEIHEGAPLTPFLGPLLSGEGNAVRRRAHEIAEIELLLEKIGSCAHIEARCNPAFDYWTPLSWHGFSQTTHYTWRLPDLSDLDGIFRGVRENIRREIRKAEKRGIRVEHGSLTDFLEIHRAIQSPSHLEATRARNRRVLEDIEAAASARDARVILVARDEDGRPHTAGYFVRDGRWVYYLVGGSDPELRTSGAGSLVMWKGIEYAAERGLSFDFEGSMVPSVERFFRSFAGVPTPYSIVRKTPSRVLRLGRPVKRALYSLR
jgi:Acetyltransferase (GNAT) domain